MWNWLFLLYMEKNSKHDHSFSLCDTMSVINGHNLPLEYIQFGTLVSLEFNASQETLLCVAVTPYMIVVLSGMCGNAAVFDSATHKSLRDLHSYTLCIRSKHRQLRPLRTAITCWRTQIIHINLHEVWRCIILCLFKGYKTFVFQNLFIWEHKAYACSLYLSN